MTNTLKVHWIDIRSRYWHAGAIRERIGAAYDFLRITRS